GFGRLGERSPDAHAEEHERAHPTIVSRVPDPRHAPQGFVSVESPRACGLIDPMGRHIGALILIAAIPARAGAEQLSLPPHSPRWELEGNAKVAEFQGRKCLALDGAAAVVKDLEMRDGVIDVDMAATAAPKGFVGFDIRIDKDGANYEEIYLRTH